MNHYLIQYCPPRPTFPADATPEESAAVERHFDYLTRLLAAGRLLVAGRTDNATLGIAVIRAESEEVARKILVADPAIEAGVFRGRVDLFRLALFAGSKR